MVSWTIFWETWLTTPAAAIRSAVACTSSRSSPVPVACSADSAPGEVAGDAASAGATGGTLAGDDAFEIESDSELEEAGEDEKKED